MGLSDTPVKDYLNANISTAEFISNEDLQSIYIIIRDGNIHQISPHNFIKGKHLFSYINKETRNEVIQTYKNKKR